MGLRYPLAVRGAILTHWLALYYLGVKPLQLAVLLSLVSILVILMHWSGIYLHAVHWVYFDGRPISTLYEAGAYSVVINCLWGHSVEALTLVILVHFCV